MKETPEQQKTRHRAYWRANIKVILSLLTVWFTVSLLCSILLVDVLNKITFVNIPFGFWMAQQGSIFTFVILIFVYVRLMDKLDHKYRMDVNNDEKNSNGQEETPDDER